MLAPFIPPIQNDKDTSNFDEYDENDNIPEYSGSQQYFDGF